MPDLATQWTGLLVRLANDRRRGFIGTVPYLFYLRLMIIAGVLGRAWLPGAHWNLDPRLIPPIVLLIAAPLALHYLVVKRQRAGRDDVQRWMKAVVLMDLAGISALYSATDTPTSDFYLFFYLPLLETAEHLRLRWTLIALISSALGFGLALWAMPGGAVVDKLVLFAMRVTFLGCFVAVSLLLTRIQSIQNLRLKEGEQEARNSVEQAQELNDRLQQGQVEIRALLELSRRLSAEFEEERIVAGAQDHLEAFGGDHALVARAGILKAGEISPSGATFSQGEHDALVLLAERVGAKSFDCTKVGTRDVVLVPLRIHHIHFGSLWAVGREGASIGRQTEAFWNLAGQIMATALARARRIEAYREISRLGAETARQDFEVEKTLRRLVVQSGFEFACISVKDKYSGRVRMVRARNVPPGWMNRSVYDAGAKDILADIVRTGKTEVIAGWDKHGRFNREIYDKFGHEQLVRMYTPILVHGEAVGVLEVGGRKERQDELLPVDKRQLVEQEAARLGEFIDGISDSQLLEKITEKAVGILGAGAAVIHVFERDRDGNEQVVLQAGQGPVIPQKVQELGTACAGKHAEQAEQAIRNAGIPFCRVLPLAVRSDRRGQLALLYWEPDPAFTESDHAVAESFARLVESLLWTGDAIKETRTRAKFGWTASSLQCVLQSLVADPGSASSVPGKLAYHLQAMLDADSIVLYEDRGGGRLLEPVRQGKLGEPRGGWAGRSKLVSELLKQGEHRFFTSEDIAGAGWRKEVGFGDRFAIREGIASCAALVLRPREGAVPVGVLFANYRTPQQFDEESTAIVEALAQTAAIALRTAQINERFQNAAEQWQKEMAALVEVEQLVLEHRGEANEVLRKILAHAIDITQARHGVILDWDPLAGKLVPGPELVYDFNGVTPPSHSKGDGIVGEAAKRGAPILLGDVDDRNDPNHKFYQPTIPDTRSQLAVPMFDEHELKGVFSLEHPDPHHFKPEHISLLKTLALQAILAKRMVHLMQEVERQRAPLRALSDVAGRIRDHRRQGDMALRLVLTGITAGTGMGFNRAAIYSLRDGWLIGRVAIGPINKAESDTIWADLSATTPMTDLLDEAERFGLSVEAGASDKELSTWVKSKLHSSETIDSLRQPMLPEEAAAGIAWVPIAAGDSGDVLGYIAADRAFTEPARPVSESDSLILRQFGQLAADILRRENALSAEDREWQRHMSGILHDVAPYFDRAMDALINLRGSDRAARHITRGVQELSRLKDLPWAKVPVRQFNLVSAISEVRDVYCEVDVKWLPPEGEVLVVGRQRTIENALIELFKNAMEQMEQKPVAQGLVILVRLTVFGDEGSQQATIEVEDNAGGQLRDIEASLFVRGSASVKGPGRGRGTARVRQTIQGYGGAVWCAQGLNGIVIGLRLPATQSIGGREKAQRAGV